jgi:hypothetical protein
MTEVNTLPKPKSISPYYQGIVALVLILIFDAVLISTSKSSPTFATSIWTNCIAMVLFYIVANCLLSLRYETNAKYVRDSLFTFLILSFLGIVLSQYLSEKTMDESGSFRWLFIVLGAGYIIFLAIINTMKFVLEWARNQDSGLRGE